MIHFKSAIVSLFIFLFFPSTNLFADPVVKDKVHSNDSDIEVRVGYFPNITHAQAVLGLERGDFSRSLKVRSHLFTAGPAVIEALFAKAIDLAYVGPMPSINGYIKSKGDALVIVAGACSGGSSLVTHKKSSILKPKDFRGKKIAVPQIGNTQDIALRKWLREQELEIKEKGGDVQIVPLSSAEQWPLFLRHDLDAVWTVEPWVSLLLLEGPGELFLEEANLWPGHQFITTNIIVRRDFLKEHSEIVYKWLEIHLKITDEIQKNPKETQEIIQQALKKITRKEWSSKVMKRAFSKIRMTHDPLAATLMKTAEFAFEMGYLGKGKVVSDLKGLYQLDPLNSILKQKKRPIIELMDLFQVEN